VRDSNPSRARGREDGAAAVEFALLVVPLLLLVLAVISYGYMLSFRQSISQAAAEAARAAALAPADADREAIARRTVQEVLGVACGSAYLSCTFPAQTCGVECVGVQLTYLYEDDPSKPVFPGAGIAIPDRLAYVAVSGTE
jgi:Flp pilus assembly pilin Flp